MSNTSPSLKRPTLVLAAWVLCGFALNASAQGPPDHDRPGDPGPPPRVAAFAEKLGLDEATIAKLKAIEGEGRQSGLALRLRLDVLHAEVRELLGAEEPDEAAVMRKADAIGELETQSRKERLRTMIQVRALLTPEQRAKLVRIHGERKRGGERGRPSGPRHHGPPGSPRF